MASMTWLFMSSIISSSIDDVVYSQKQHSETIANKVNNVLFLVEPNIFGIVPQVNIIDDLSNISKSRLNIKITGVISSDIQNKNIVIIGQNKKQSSFRITSYNVCYTKLLRYVFFPPISFMSTSTFSSGV